MKIVKIIMTLIILLAAVACDRDIHPIKTKPFSQKNPIVYEFVLPVSEVREKIIKAFNDFNLTRKLCSSLNETKSCLFSVATKEDPVFSGDTFTNLENNNDLYLYPHDLIGPSPIYFGGGQPLEYRAEFQLHLTDLGNKRTRVSVIPHNPKVINGSKCCSPHGYYSNYVPVEPTTIEEYKILLFIGNVLGINDMPPLRMPEGTEK